MTSLPEHVGMSEAVRITGFSASTLRRYVRLGKLEAFETPGGRLRFDLPALESLLRPVDTVGERGTAQ